MADAENRRRAASLAGLTVPVVPETDACPRCGRSTFVLKSDERKFVTLAHGHFVAREVWRACKAGCREPSGKKTLTRSQALARLAPPGGVYGYDIEFYVGLQRFCKRRQRVVY